MIQAGTSAANLPVAILARGMATRLRPITEKSPIYSLKSVVNPSFP